MKEKRVEELQTSHLRLSEFGKSEAEPGQIADSLRNHEAYFRAITQNASDIVFVVDREGLITYANPPVERFLGYQPEALIGKSGFDLIVPADIPRAHHDFSNAITTTGEIFPNAFCVRHNDGSERVLEGFGTNLLDNPIVNGFVMNVRDVTDREVSEAARRESENKFSDLAEQSPIGIYILQEGIFTYVNPKFAEMYGSTVGEVIQKIGVKDLIHPADWPLVAKRIQENASGKTELFHDELRAVKKSGEIIHIEVYDSRTLYQGKTAIIGSVMDITERKSVDAALTKRKALLEQLVAIRTADLKKTNDKLEQEIAENNRSREALICAKKEWEQTFDSVPDLISIIDADHRILRVNKAMAEKLGGSPQEAVGVKCYACIHDTAEPLPSCPHTLLLADGQEHASEMYIERWGGTYNISASPLYGDEGQVLRSVHVARDITERKLAEDLLETVVKERTAELSQKNKQLVQEIKERKRVEAALKKKAKELQLHSVKLEELNIALKVLLSKREEDRKDLEDRILSNVKHLLTPHFETLKKKKLDQESRSEFEILENNIREITSSFSHKLSSKYLNLTPTEIKVANLVKEGKSIKEIAEMMGVSHFTIDLHRFNIRKKLGIKSRKINLQSYLQSIS